MIQSTGCRHRRQDHNVSYWIHSQLNFIFVFIQLLILLLSSSCIAEGGEFRWNSIPTRTKISKSELQQQQQQQSRFHVSRRLQEEQYHRAVTFEENGNIIQKFKEQQLLQQRQLQEQQLQEQNSKKNEIEYVQQLSRKERIRLENQLVQELLNRGFHDHVGHSRESQLLRHHMLRKKKHRHSGVTTGSRNKVHSFLQPFLSFFTKTTSTSSDINNLPPPSKYDATTTAAISSSSSSSFSFPSIDEYLSSSSSSSSSSSKQQQNDVTMMDILFPGMKPELYDPNEILYSMTDQCRSSKTHVPYDFYETLPTCSIPTTFLQQLPTKPTKKQFFFNTRGKINNNKLGGEQRKLESSMNYNNNNTTTTATSSDQHHHHRRRHHPRKNLGSKLQGSVAKASPYVFTTLVNQSCYSVCETILEPYQIRFLRKLMDRQYRNFLVLDQLPILIRNSYYNYAIRGYPIGFVAPPSHTGLQKNEYYLYNHLKFTITYQKVYQNQKQNNDKISNEDTTILSTKSQRRRVLLSENEEATEGDGEQQQDDDSTTNSNTKKGFVGIHITGFDVYPVSIDYNKVADNVCSGHNNEDDNEDTTKKSVIQNDPQTYLSLRGVNGSTTVPVRYTFEVEWLESDLPWEDRWDVYLLYTPDDDIHLFAIINSFMIVLFLTGSIAIIMIRTLKKDIMTYNKSDSLSSKKSGTSTTTSAITAASLLFDDSENDDGGTNVLEETGWKLVHGDVFRPPSNKENIILLSCCVGTGVQLGCASLCTMFLSLLRIVNPIKKGQFLTAILALFVLSGYVNGYISARIHKYCCSNKNNNKGSTSSGTQQQYQQRNNYNNNWVLNTFVTATALPGTFVTIFIVLNTLLSYEGASTAVSFLTIVQLFALWIGVSGPLVCIGSYHGYKQQTITVPTKVNMIARLLPNPDFVPWYSIPPYSYLVGGILPFGSVCIELFFILNALWLQQIYYVMGSLFAVLLILAATCAQVSIVMVYMQLCSEDYNWWWKSFGNCASAGFYLFLYSLWFLWSKMDIVGILSFMIYVTYMAMFSISFGLFCGSIGFLCAFWFNRTIYGALHKVD